MTQQEQSIDSNGPTQAAVQSAGSAFEYLTLELFSERGHAATQLLRSQHAELQVSFDRIRQLSESGAEKAAESKNLMTRMVANLHVHMQMERGILGKQMGSDPRIRALFDQFERELAPVRSMINEWTRSFPTPSAIAASAHEFKGATERLVHVLEERFRHVERDLYVECERIVVQ